MTPVLIRECMGSIMLGQLFTVPKMWPRGPILMRIKRACVVLWIVRFGRLFSLLFC
jgi:hypothetical protein